MPVATNGDPPVEIRTNNSQALPISFTPNFLLDRPAKLADNVAAVNVNPPISSYGLRFQEPPQERRRGPTRESVASSLSTYSISTLNMKPALMSTQSSRERMLAALTRADSDQVPF